MKGVNEKNVEFDIGSKIFPLDEIKKTPLDLNISKKKIIIMIII